MCRISVTPLRRVRATLCRKLVCLTLAASAAHAQLNDTGQTTCTDTDGTVVGCTDVSGIHPGQDARFGRDARASGAAFDFYPISGGCVADRVTGLIWSDETLSATWADANTAATGYDRCGIDDDWRLPTRRELLSLVHHGENGPAIDAGAFPATQSAPYWSSDTQGGDAWTVDFSDGDTKRIARTETHAARLVARPVNQPPAITLGANIVVPREERPGPLTFPGWATGISPGPAREAGQHLTATVTLLPVTGEKALEFEMPPAIDPATGDLMFTIKHKLVTVANVPQPYDIEWESSAGLARVQVTLRDDGGTANGGVDSVTRTFEISLDPTPRALDIEITHIANCHFAGPANEILFPVTLLAWDADTDPVRVSPYDDGNTHWPTYRIKNQPSRGFFPEANLGAVMSSRLPFSVLDGTPMGNYNATLLYTTFSTTFDGVDSFTYTVVDKDGNESNEGFVLMHIVQPSCNHI